MNFSLQQQTSSTAPPPAAAQDLPPLQKRGAKAKKRSVFRSLLLLGAVLGTAAVVVVLLGVPIPGLGRVNKTVAGLMSSQKVTILTYKVKKGTLPVTLTERGSLESSNNQDVYNKVENQTTIINILDEGSRVKKGDLVVELDSAQLNDNLDTQKIATASAQANLENAKKTLEVAEIAVREYEEGTYPQSVQSAESDIILARSDLQSKKESLDFNQKMFDFKYIPESKLTQEKLNYERSKITLENNKTKLEVLKKYTYDKTIKELRADVEKATADMLAKETTYNLEKQKEEKLRRQIENCKLYAPDDGMVVYANDPNQAMRGSNAPQIEAGATVRERQKIFILPDLDNMQVNTKVNEAMIDRIKAGQRCKIRVEAQAGEPLAGTVSRVATMADQASFFSSDVKVYTTSVKIDNSPSSLRPGMSAQVEILIEQLDDVMSVPVQAILSFGGKDHVYVRQGDEWSRVEVKLGTSNDKLIEISEGLNEGDEVALSPLALMSEEEKQKVFGAGAKGATAKDWSSADASKSKAAGTGEVKGEGKADGKAEKKARKKDAAGGGGGGGMPSFVAKFKNISAEDREALKTASEDERAGILKKAGFTDDELNQMKSMAPPGGGGRGGFGGGPGGPGGPGGQQ
ncbi:MAG: efflux RND transporter periplasmic adaptor subunit [Isosphaeraceae bacterium]